jgi:branched-subunit amino acid ABC-type transport system permease component
MIPNLLNHAILALIYASTLIILTIGINVVYSVMKFSNFAHGDWITMGLFMSWWSLQILTNLFPSDSYHIINNLLIQAIFGFIIVGLCGILGEIFIYNRLRKLKASFNSFIVISIGIGLIIRNFLAMIFGAYPEPNKTICPTCSYDSSLPGFLPNLSNFFTFTLTENNPIFGTQWIRIGVSGILIIFTSIIMVLTIDYIFKHTKFGISMRATADSMELAQISGIDTQRIIYYTWFLAAGLTGFGASIYRPYMTGPFNILTGFYMLVPIFAVAILGGVGSFRGGIIAAFIIAYARQITVILFSQFQTPGGLEDILEKHIGFTITFSPGYADAIAFAVLIIVLLYRPQGIAGNVKNMRDRF